MTGDANRLDVAFLGGALGVAGALAWQLRRPAADARAVTNASAGSPSSIAAGAPAAADRGRWIYPVPSLGARTAVISNPFRARAADSGSPAAHLGADLMFRRSDARELVAAYPPGTSSGTAMFFMPEAVPALAASAGIVVFADATPIGNTVVVRHPNGWATYYTHLAALAVARGAAVVAGQVIGTIGASPRDPERLRHLHFELWRNAARSGAVDPAPFLAAWERTSIAWSPRTVPVVASVGPALRNGGLSPYRSVGNRGEPYPTWVRQLRGASGVYVIRELGGPVVYVGSSVGRLYETLTRHFQAVRHEAQEAPMT